MTRAAAWAVTEEAVGMLVREEAEATAKLAGAGLGLAAPDLAAGLAVGTAAEKAARAAEDLDLVAVGLVPVVEAATAKEEAMAAAAMVVAAVTAAAQKRRSQKPSRGCRSTQQLRVLRRRTAIPPLRTDRPLLRPVNPSQQPCQFPSSRSNRRRKCRLGHVR